MCLDENDGSFVLTKMTGRVSLTKTPSCACGLSLYFAEVEFFFFPILGLSGTARGGLQPHQRKIERKERSRPFHQQRHQFAFFFSCLLFPSFHFFCCLGSKSIHRSIEQSRSPGGMCFSHTMNTLVFSDHVCLCFFSALGVCNLNLVLSRIFSVFFHFSSFFLSDAI